ncbi:MAG: rod-binding protein [Lachnospiraceae bacterium]|nr:rod-binding protein [Lachnospiraceae bacterium]
MDIDSSYFSNYLNNVQDDAASKTAQYTSLKNRLNSTDKNTSDDELMDVCKQFEAYFIEQVFKEMEKTVPKSDMGYNSDDRLVNFFKDDVRQKLASKAGEQQGLGLAQMMYEQMKRNYSAVIPPEAETPKTQDTEKETPEINDIEG